MKLIYLFALLATINVFALESRYFTTTEESLSERTVHLYQEQNKWIVESFQRQINKLPQLEDRDVFLNYHEALNHFATLESSKESIRVINFPTVETEVASRVIWEAKNRWNKQWEKRFANWIETEVDLEFFRRYGVSVDCADVALSMRWIFSFIHKLPVANSLTSNGQVVSHETFRYSYRNLKRSETWYKDQVFMQALRDLNNTTSTKSLINDLYPAKINRDYIIPGAVYMTTGHTRVIKRVTHDGSKFPIEFTYGTVPASLNTYREYFFLNQNEPKRSKGGILHFRWPYLKNGRWRMLPENQMTDYSLEQYSGTYQSDFYQKIFEKLNIVINPPKIISSIAKNMKELLEVRKEIVEQGHQICQRNPCPKRPNGLYDAWSTPTRDKRISALFKNLESFALRHKMNSLRKQYLKDTKLEINNALHPLESLEKYFDIGVASGDPRDPIDARWGLDHQYIALKKRRDIEKYRKTYSCLQPNCQEKTSATLKIQDQKIRERHLNSKIAEYLKICHNSQEANCKLKDDEKLKKVLANNSEVDSNSISLIPRFVSSLEQATDNYLILDSNKVFNLDTGEIVYEVNNDEKIFFFKTTQTWLVLDSLNKLIYLDINFQTILTKKMGDSLSNSKIRVISGDHFLFKTCPKSASCQFDVYQTFPEKLKKIDTANSSGVFRSQTDESIVSDKKEGICLTNYKKKESTCYYTESDQTKSIKNLDVFSINYFYNKKIFWRKDKSIKVKDIQEKKIWDTGISGSIAAIKEINSDWVFLSTTNSGENCYALNFQKRKIYSSSCHQYSKLIVSKDGENAYIKAGHKDWAHFNSQQGWKHLPKKSAPLGFTEDNKLLFLADLEEGKKYRVECSQQYSTGFYPCHGSKTSFDLIREKKYLPTDGVYIDLFKGNTRLNSLIWAPSYYRSQNIVIYPQSKLIQHTKELYYLIR